MIAEWTTIPGYPNYMINENGDVFNKRFDKVMARSKTLQGDYKVTLVNEGYRITRSVRVLVAENFVSKPEMNDFEDRVLFDTVIILDNDKHNVCSDNLAWRPSWFAQKYSRQFSNEYPEPYYFKPVLNVNTQIVYSSILHAGVSEGLLFEDVWRSTVSRDMIFPTGHVYIFT